MKAKDIMATDMAKENSFKDGGMYNGYRHGKERWRNV